jgi:preprotein translocase subunit SecG
MISKNKFYYYQNLFFNIFIVVSYILIFVTALGFNNGTKYLQDLDYYVRIYICLFLLWRFNPIFPVKEFTDLDRKIAFSAGFFILTTTALNAWLEYAKQKAKNTIQNIKNKIHNK